MASTSGGSSILPLTQQDLGAIMANILPVDFIPSQLDTNSASTPLPFRGSPVQLLLADLWLVLRLLRFVLHIFTPIGTRSKYGELYLKDPGNIRDLTLHVVLSVVGIVWLLAFVPVFLLFPGFIFCIFNVAFTIVVWLLCRILNYGPRTYKSTFELGETVQLYPDERWLFINGVDCGTHWLKQNINMISETFKRPVLGIHNRSYGTVLDLIECLIQRCFSYATQDTRIIYQYLKEQLMDDTVKKCVVIAHSQGGIILSNVLDMLFADLPFNALEKLEIYTFGSAANHFNNPIRSPSQQTAPTNESDGTRLIKHIEHYANEWDFVARFGVLHFARTPPDNRYVGRVFVRKGAGGHLMNMHYLDKMFPIEDADMDDGFLNQVVGVDEVAAVDREQAAVDKGYMGDRANAPAGAPRSSFSEEDRKVIKRAATDLAHRSARRQKGKTVKELSRLWRYRGGGRAD